MTSGAFEFVDNGMVWGIEDDELSLARCIVSMLFILRSKIACLRQLQQKSHVVVHSVNDAARVFPRLRRANGARDEPKVA